MNDLWLNNIKFKKCLCRRNNEIEEPLDENIIHVYVVLSRRCNANCKFCSFTGDEVNIDFEIFKERLKEILSISKIGTLHFTGGEPTLRINELKELLNIVKTESLLTLTTINTNGTHLKELDGLEDLDNISLSRHSYKEEDNKYLMGNINGLPSNEDIKNFKDKYKLHLSCNLVKGFIDNEEEIVKYLEFAASVGVIDVGIVGLMKVNEFCNTNYIDLNDIKFKDNDQMIKTRWHDNVSEETGNICCKCVNWLYRTNDAKSLISLYYRYAIRNNEVADYLVYENNHIKQGFNGNILI